ncbi:hypothetical protein RJ44_01995 [Alteromonas macleodii]|uniref:hypothetical protein n=1 Tax=Alteromonas macleodii TaxID=28108 RepID=UPI00057D328B|nr:hypothetical protein [Alteromonas macleodii]KHT61018.1 hypothetical protein RJ44_01995 [Alteromonas macleodii]
MEWLLRLYEGRESMFTAQFFAALTAALTFLVAWRQHTWNKKHHLVSIRPFICDFFRIDLSTLELTLTLSNKGLGPAQLVNYEFEWDGKKVDKGFVDEFLADSFTSDFRLYLVDLSGVSAMSPNENQILLSVSYANVNKFTEQDSKTYIEVCGQLVKNLRIQVDYKSLHGNDIYTYKTKPLRSLLDDFESG